MKANHRIGIKMVIPTNNISTFTDVAPCNVHDCSDLPRLALGHRNFCALHADAIVGDLRPDEVASLISSGYATQPVSRSQHATGHVSPGRIAQFC